MPSEIFGVGYIYHYVVFMAYQIRFYKPVWGWNCFDVTKES